MKVKFKKFSKAAILPQKATPGAAAYDVCIPENILIKPGRQVIKLGFGIQMPINIEAMIDPRSGFSSKGMEGCISSKTTYNEDGLFHTTEFKTDRFDADVIPGKIDSDYRGEVGVIINNRSEQNFNLLKGTRIAQMTFYQVEDIIFEEVEVLEESERGEGGFGHTGSK